MFRLSKLTNISTMLLLLASLAVGAPIAYAAEDAGAPDKASVAQQAAPATAVGTTQATTPPPPNQGGYPYDYPSDTGNSPEEKKELPKPQNPVRKVLDGGKVQIIMGNDRHFGHRIGDHIPVTVLIATAKDVKLDFTSLEQGKLSFEGSDFELAGPVTVKSQVQNDMVVYRIDLTLQTWVPKPNVVFNLDLRYATELTPDGKTPNWQKLTTPDFVVTRSATADNGEELLEGDLDAKQSAQPWATYPLLVTGIFLVLLWPGLVLVKWLNRVRPRKVLPPKAAAWRVLTPVLKDARDNGYNEEHYKKILMALRRYLEATKGVPVEPSTFLEIQDRLENDPDLADIESALTKCERVIYAGETLEDADNRELVKEIERLVPRPWEEK